MDLNDVAGFTDLVQSISQHGENSVDVLMHSPGGQVDAAERIVQILRQRFDHVSFLIPHSAYSAATMLALSGDEIILHPSATLGPIDPQIGGVPVRSITKGFEEARIAIETSGPEALPAYLPLLQKYSLDLLEICNDAEALAKELVTEWLGRYMLAGSRTDKARIESISEYFASYDLHLTHSRPITQAKLREHAPELKVEAASEELESLLWQAFILIDGLFDASPFVKLFENCHGISWGKIVQQQFIQFPLPTQQPG